jgi:hypothetical protein
MTESRRKRPRDPAQLAKLIVDIATGEVEDREPTTDESGKSASAVLAPVFCSYAAGRRITGNLRIASNFFDIGTCSYLRPMPGVL